MTVGSLEVHPLMRGWVASSPRAWQQKADWLWYQVKTLNVSLGLELNSPLGVKPGCLWSEEHEFISAASIQCDDTQYVYIWTTHITYTLTSFYKHFSFVTDNEKHMLISDIRKYVLLDLMIYGKVLGKMQCFAALWQIYVD